MEKGKSPGQSLDRFFPPIHCSEADGETRRKGGVLRGNGEALPPRPPGQAVPVPRGFCRRLRRYNGETVKLLLYLMYHQWEVGQPGAVARTKEIADGAGLSVEMAEEWLSALADSRIVERHARGWRLRQFPVEEWEPDW